jgi:hypothetical protein
MTDDMTQLARFVYDMALTAPEDVIKRQALFNAYMELHGRLVAKLAEIGAWTDDDQRGLNAAVADAMWHWDTRNEGPLDPDDAISLAESLKFHLKDNGFQIVRLATRTQGESS